MLVARRLHPQARLFFPGSREGSLRRMLEERGVELEELRHRDVDPAALARVVLCDTRQRERLGVVAQWLLARPEIEVLAYDHHPDSPSGSGGGGGRIDPTRRPLDVGRRLLRERGCGGADERRWLLMGITGHRVATYATQPADLAAAAALRRGGDSTRCGATRCTRSTRPPRDAHRMTEELEVRRCTAPSRTWTASWALSRRAAPLVSRCLECRPAILFASRRRRSRHGDRAGQPTAPRARLGRWPRGGHDTAAAGAKGRPRWRCASGARLLTARAAVARAATEISPSSPSRRLHCRQAGGLGGGHQRRAGAGGSARGPWDRQLLDDALSTTRRAAVTSVMARSSPGGAGGVGRGSPPQVGQQHPRLLPSRRRCHRRASGGHPDDVLRLHGRLERPPSRWSARPRRARARRVSAAS